MNPVTLQTRELAARESDGIHVLLLWHPSEDAVTVSVDDTRAGQRFDLAVARDRALEAFYHPFAYAAQPDDLNTPQTTMTALERQRITSFTSFTSLLVRTTSDSYALDCRILAERKCAAGWRCLRTVGRVALRVAGQTSRAGAVTG